MTPSQLFAKLGLRLLLVLCCIVLLELAFRFGAWEIFVRPESNAGQSIRLKESVKTLGAGNLEFITLGDSRTVYGIEHQRVADAAKTLGFNHANLSLAGSHWMTINSIVEWVTGRGAHLKGTLIAMSNSSFVYTGNGYYEIGSTAPFMSSWDTAKLSTAVPFDKKEMGTYGVYSALFQYREDIQNLLMQPCMRLREKHAYASQGIAALSYSVKTSANMCSVPTSTIANCAAAIATKPSDVTVINHCKAELAQSKSQLDWRNWQTPGAVPHLAALAKLRQSELRSMNVKKPILLVLMPEVKLRSDALNPKGIDEFVRATLQPLVDDGTIVLHDYTRFFDDDVNGECSVFWDLLHQNTLGQQRLTDALIPVIRDVLYGANQRTLVPIKAR